MNNLVTNLIVFVLVGGVLTFVISIVIHSRRQEKEEKNKDKMRERNRRER